MATSLISCCCADLPVLACPTGAERAGTMTRLRTKVGRGDEAIASNPIAVLVPCHRVIKKDASISFKGTADELRQTWPFVRAWHNCSDALDPVSRPRAFHIGRQPLSESRAAADIGKADLVTTSPGPALNDHTPRRDVDDASAAEAEITRLVLCPSGIAAAARRTTPARRWRGPAPISVRFKTGRRASVVTLVILRRRDVRRGGHSAKGKQNAEGRFREVDHQSNSRWGIRLRG